MPGPERERVVLAVHGGAGPFLHISEQRRDRAAQGLTASLQAGLAALDANGTALDAAVAAVRVLEDDDTFNAGRGSVLTSAGTVEMDAAVADGATNRLGAAALVTGVRNPVELARAVLDDGTNVLLAGPAATALARRLGLPFEPPEYFITRHAPAGGGTVGAVARDQHGNLAAATSTGGRAGKVEGRIGDTPIAGAGTWADNATCAISATGDGEAFFLAAFAHEVDARLRLTGPGASLAEACEAALEVVRARGGTGGCVALTATGTLAAPYTSGGMFRAWADEHGRLHVPAPDQP